MEGAMHSPNQSTLVTALAIVLTERKMPHKKKAVCTRICFSVTGHIPYHARIMETQLKLRCVKRRYTNERFT